MSNTPGSTMNNGMRPFDSIESALEFMVLLETVTEEVSVELQQLLPTAAQDKRYNDGLLLALHKIQQLSEHVGKSRRILNDLTLIRGLLLGNTKLPADDQQSS